jgi:hypothetical protein
LAAVALLAALGACGRDAVEPKLVGTWQTAVASPTGPYQLRFTTLSNGQYQTLAQGPAPVPAETGLLKAAGGKFRREKLNGGIDEGTYEFLSADSVLFKSKTETLLWSRVPNDAAAAAQPAASSAAQAGSLAPSATSAAAAQPSADLLAAGPFGAPLPKSAAFAPQGATIGGSSGGVAPPAPQAKTGGASGAAQQAPATPASGSDAPAAPPTNMQHAKQAAAQATTSAHQAAASAHQAAASAGEAADAVKAEADERVGPFRKAGSKIKSFFTGHKSDADANGNANADTNPPAQQNGH